MSDIESTATAPVTFNSGAPDIYPMWGPPLDAGTDSREILYLLYLNSPDGDGDGLGDGQEIFGYNVTFSYYTGKGINLLASIEILKTSTSGPLGRAISTLFLIGITATSVWLFAMVTGLIVHLRK